MGVLNVNVGDAVTPDWRNIGCGGRPPGITDNFNRADGTSVVANRSDGGLWTLPSGSLWAILSNRLVKQVNSTGKISADHGAYTDSITIEAVCKWPDPYARCQVGILGSDAGGSGGAFIEACPFEGYFRVVGPGFGANLLGVTPEDGAEHTLSLTVDLTTGDFVGKFDGVTQQTGTFTSIPTGTVATADTYNWVMSNPSTGVLNGFDSVTVTGVGSAALGRLKLWDGTRWMREACDNDAGPTFTDNFNRANSTSSIGGAWQIWTGTAGISSNQGYFPTGPTYAYIDVGSAVQDITITNARDTTDGGSGIMVNYDPAAATAHALPQYGYVFNFDSSSSVAGLSNGPQNGLNAGTLTLTAWTAGSTTLRITSDGAGTITAYQNGVQVAQILPGEPTFTTLRGTCIAIFCNTSAATHDRWDDMTVLTGAEKHPLKMWDGTTWQTVACMTPA